MAGAENRRVRNWPGIMPRCLQMQPGRLASRKRAKMYIVAWIVAGENLAEYAGGLPWEMKTIDPDSGCVWLQMRGAIVRHDDAVLIEHFFRHAGQTRTADNLICIAHNLRAGNA